MTDESELEHKRARLAELKAKLAGKIGFAEANDITHWYAAVHEFGCPNCGVDFRTMHPAHDLYHHFTGACAS